jgi:hypothetical protein
MFCAALVFRCIAACPFVCSLLANSALIGRFTPPACTLAALPSNLPFCCTRVPVICSLLANSALISRYAALRAKALALPAAATLYGPSLTVAQPAAAAAGSGSSSSAVTGAGQLYDSVAELELRLSGTMGIEVRICIELTDAEVCASTSPAYMRTNVIAHCMRPYIRVLLCVCGLFCGVCFVLFCCFMDLCKVFFWEDLFKKMLIVCNCVEFCFWLLPLFREFLWVGKKLQQLGIQNMCIWQCWHLWVNIC